MLSLFLAGAAPGGSRARFGLGLETFFEHQESLRITGMESTFTLRDLVRGEEESGVLHGDPRLLNRKFDIVWEMEGAGIELPVILSHFGGSARSTLVLKAATADVTLDFLDRTQPQDSSSLGGRGSLFGAELSFASEPSPNRPWFTEASLGFQKIPQFGVERSPRFGPAGFEVPEDEVRLGRDVQELAARIGYSFSGGRVSAYTGVLHRWTDLEIEDDLRYRDPLGATETRLMSQTDLESEVSLAVAGVEYRRGNRLHGRLEASVGEEDWGMVGRVVYRSQSTRTRTREEIEAFAVSIASLLAEIEATFRACRKVLALKDYPVADVARLLDWTEIRLLDVIDLEELDPIRASIQFRFGGFRKDLGLAQPSPGKGPQTPCERTGIAPASYRPAQSGQDKSTTLDKVGALLLRATGLARTGNFTLNLCVTSEPKHAKYIMSSPKRRRVLDGETEDLVSAGRGLYLCKLQHARATPPEFEKGDPDFPCFDLWESEGDQLIECNFATRTCVATRLSPQRQCPSR